MTAEQQVIDRALRMLLRAAFYEPGCDCADCKFLSRVEKVIRARAKRRRRAKA